VNRAKRTRLCIANSISGGSGKRIPKARSYSGNVAERLAPSLEPVSFEQQSSCE
jgi:hypothetical protein